MSSTDAVLDGLRVGQEALDKASALQLRGMTSLLILVSQADLVIQILLRTSG